MTVGAREASGAEAAGAGDEAAHLLTSAQVAHFVARGFLRLDGIVPHPLCAETLREMEADARPGAFAARRGERKPPLAGRPVDEVWPAGGGSAAVMRLPAVRGIIRSLLGPGALYDHHHAHVVEAGHRFSQPWHADAIIDPRMAFDIQRSLLVCHHGLWHCGQPNTTRARRHMLKVRLNPSVPQRLCWDTGDREEAAVREVLTTPEPWHGNEGRLEIVNRLRLWRMLTDDPSFDADHWLTRLELPRQG